MIDRETYALLLDSLLLNSVLVSYVAALGTELFGELRALSEGAIGVAVWVLLEYSSAKEYRRGVWEGKPQTWCWSRGKHGHPWLRSRGARPWGGWRSWQGLSRPF